MSRLEPWREPEREPIRVIIIPHLQCDAEGCGEPLAADLIWNDVAHEALHLLHICGWHAVFLKGKGPAVVFPLHRAPGLHAVARWMQQEARKRHAAAAAMRQPTVTVTFSGGFSQNWGTGSGSNMGWGGFYR